ncbi:MAG: serine/threonine protein kinase, partial [Planctomycetota bacterium]
PFVYKNKVIGRGVIFLEIFPMQGKTLGNFVLEKKINQGGFGEIWEAFFEGDPSQKFAVKILDYPEGFDYLKQEYQVLKKLHHPQILKPTYADFEHDPPYVVLEYIEGENLREILKSKGGFSLKETLNIIDQLLDIVEYIHKKGVVHCDIKPENIILRPNGEVILLDFGLAFCPETLQSQILLSGAFDSGTKNIAGTIQYMSPEQKKGEKITPSVDIYALGVLFYELLTGELPEFGEMPNKALNEKEKNIPALSEKVNQFFLLSVATLSKRFKSAKEMKKSLKEIHFLLNPVAPKVSWTQKILVFIVSIPKFYKKIKDGVVIAWKKAYQIAKLTLLVLFLMGLGYLGWKISQIDFSPKPTSTFQKSAQQKKKEAKKSQKSWFSFFFRKELPEESKKSKQKADQEKWNPEEMSFFQKLIAYIWDYFNQIRDYFRKLARFGVQSASFFSAF